ncbi:hypothetical protein [uncultured Tenacibaculum sp.]|uniref:hypothetical protein n=1 Tax=uncultured Tenacibaculum sp. TaxID=174713 RepID=UPI002632B2E7|nr:hypothetical protein [uncultured Tenacibaculum sp.]
MGWDISYHPISEEQIIERYFNVLDDKTLITELSAKYNIKDFYAKKYEELIDIALVTTQDDVFDKTHGYYIAATQGFFEKYFYVRGSALSFLEGNILSKYTKSWQEILPQEKLTDAVHNQIIENYCSGKFIPPENIELLLENYDNDLKLQEEINTLFSHERIGIFFKAMYYALDKGLGLLEATEIIEPNPMDLNSSVSYSNLFNCDPQGALLYRDAAMEQLSKIEEEKDLTPGTITSNTNYEVSNHKIEEKEPKKSFWKRLFKK